MKKVFAKRIVMVIAAVALVSGFGFATNMKVAEAKSQENVTDETTIIPELLM